MSIAVDALAASAAILSLTYTDAYPRNKKVLPMRGLKTVFSCAALSILSGAAQAVPITLDFSGTFTELFEDSGGYASLLGQSYAGRIVYESDTPGTQQGFAMLYNGAILEAALSIGALPGDLAGSDTSYIRNLPGGANISGVGLLTFAFLANIPGLVLDESITANLAFIKGLTPLGESAAIPTEFTLADLPGIDPRSGRGNWSSFNLSSSGRFAATGRFETVNAYASVPEPGAIGLLTIGLAGLLVARRRTKSPRQS